MRKFHSEYRCWANIKQRCCNPNNKSFLRYGGRGIKMCDRWFASFNNFLTDVGLRPSPQHSMERKNNNGNYEPENCVWAVTEVQGNNKRNNRVLSAFGQTQTIRNWSKILNISYWVLIWRDNQGWPPEKTLTKRVGVQALLLTVID